MLDSVQDLPGLTWTTDCQPPCESANSITLTLTRPTGCHSFSFAVPFPFVEDTVEAVQSKPGLIRLHLQKAIYEPWPTQFTSRWNYTADDLPPFKYVGDDHLMELSVHLEQQFECGKIPNTPENLSFIHFRLAICRMFEFVVKNQHEFFMIAASGNEDVNIPASEAAEPDWYVKVHLPIRCDKNANPMLLLSVFDCNLAPKLVSRGEISEEKIDADFKRLFSCEANSDSKNMPLITLTSRRASQLFRCLLRYNSNQIFPSQWQEQNLPLGENTPWLATFLSPCFSQYPRSSSEIWEQFKMKKRQFVEVE